MNTFRPATPEEVEQQSTEHAVFKGIETEGEDEFAVYHLPEDFLG